MSKRKSAAASKHTRSPKVAARAQRNKQAVVRSPKDNSLRSVVPLRSVAAGPTETPLKIHEEPKQKDPAVERMDPVVENRVAALKAAALHDGGSQMMRDNNPKKGFDFSLATESVQAYQAKLLEMTQANIEFAFEFSQRLGTIRSPFEAFGIIAEFTRRWIDMYGKYSKEVAGYPFLGIDASRELTALRGR
ncbi:Phasin protein [Bradyrhizobium sp. CCBAU 051011]|uniref:phasin family protein n=1 Tax=Bradyrhizobium sp. CCBAU 051011 TaxID=858422 RepID=UPI0013741B1E|nr:phasin family protein [Bradyrhizobium sp. CCBAU 051011]QHO78891.1 Phasin protein [Bradyrhizobium sp. CCBAU 051011]